MNLPELITRVQSTFGDTVQAVISEDDITRWANDGQIDIVKRTEVLTNGISTPATLGNPFYALPADFLFSGTVSFDGYALEFKSKKDIIRDNRYYNDTGSALYYFIESRQVVLYPIPSTSEVGKSIDIFYICRPTTLEVGVQEDLDIPVEMHEDLVDYCLMRAKERDDDLNAADYFKTSFKDRIGISASDSQFPYTESYPSVRDTDNY